MAWLVQALRETPLPILPCGKSFQLPQDGLKPLMSSSLWSVYIIRCGDGSLYTGIATDVDRRFSEHSEQGPKAAKYLRGRLPLDLVYRKEIGNRSEASKEELRIKSLSVSKKVILISSG